VKTKQAIKILEEIRAEIMESTEPRIGLIPKPQPESVQAIDKAIKKLKK